VNSLLAIDPGARTGYAYFLREKDTWALVGAAVSAPSVYYPCALSPDYVVIECPDRIFSYARTKDILKLARIVGRYEERYESSSLLLVTPHAWKGSVNGDIMTARIRAALTAPEAEIVRGLDHNGLDAVGLGKWAVRQARFR
jgi:hypothetical protein